MASENYLEDALNAEVDETAVSALMKSLESQLHCTTMRGSNNEDTSRDVIKSSKKIEGGKDNLARVYKTDVVNVERKPVETRYINICNSTPPVSLERNKSADISRTINLVTGSSGHAQSSNCLPVNSQVQPDGPSIKFQENIKPVYCTGSHIQGNRVAFQPGLLPNRNIGHSIIPPQSLLKMTSAMSNVINVTEPQTPSANPVMIQLANIPGMDHLKTEGRNVMMRSSGNANVTSGPPLLMSVVPVPITGENLGSSDKIVNSVNSNPANIPGIISLPKPNSSAVGVPQAVERNSANTICPPNLQIVNVIPLRPDTPVKQEQKNIPQRVVIGTPQLAANRAGQANIMPIPAHKGAVGGPTQGHLLLKAQNGQYQWVRVNLATAKPGLAIPPTSKSCSAIGAGVNISKPVSQDVIQTSQPTLMPQNTKGQYIVDNTCKEKCYKFLTKILELANNESESTRKSIYSVVQDLIDGKFEPDYFCRCLEVLLNSKSTHCLVDFLKKSLPIFRIALMTKELVLGGIRPPMYHLGLPSPSPAVIVPQLQTLPPSSHPTPPTPQQQSILIQRHTDTSSLLKQQDIVWQTQLRSQFTSKTSNMSQPQNQVNLLAPTHILPQSNTQPCLSQSLVRPQNATLRTFPARLLRPQPSIPLSTNSQSPTLTTNDNIVQCNPANLSQQINLNNTTSNASEMVIGRTNDSEERKLNSKEVKHEKSDFESDVNSTKSTTDESFLNIPSLNAKISKIVQKYGLQECTPEFELFVSQACRERIKYILQRLSCIAEHRTYKYQNNIQNDVMYGIQGQLKFLEEVDRIKSKNQENNDGKYDLSDQARLKAKYKKGLKAEMKELRQQEANQTALQAIGFRKKPKTGNENDNTTQMMNSKNVYTPNSRQIMDPPRRFKRVTIKDLIWHLEHDKQSLPKKFLYKAYHNW